MVGTTLTQTSNFLLPQTPKQKVCAFLTLCAFLTHSGCVKWLLSFDLCVKLWVVISDAVDYWITQEFANDIRTKTTFQSTTL